MGKKYFGIADCHGIESFIESKGKEQDKESLFILYLRVMANRQRHAVLYTVELEQEEIDAINEYIKNGNYIEALRILKLQNVSFPEAESKHFQKSWNLIPNPDLDPWS